MTVQLRPIDRSLLASIDAIRASVGHTLSSHAATNLYLWQEQMQLSIHLETDFFAVKCGIGGENCWFFPCGCEAQVHAFIRAGLSTPDFSLCYMTEQEAIWLEGQFPGVWVVARDESADEYVCRVDDFVSLAGGAYRRMRNRIHHIERTHAVEVVRLTADHWADARALLESWQQEAHNNKGYLLADDCVSLTALSEREELGIEGILLLMDGVPTAVVAGFPLDEQTLDAVIGKSLHDAPAGTVFCALRHYMCTCGRGYTFCNMEEDLGIPGLRSLKEEMRPAFKNQMWTAVLK